MKLSAFALFNQRIFLNMVLANLPVALFCENPEDEFKITLWNKTCEHMFGIPSQDAVGKSDFQIWPESVATYFRQMSEKAIEEKRPVFIPAEKFIFSDERQMWLRLWKIPIVDRSEQPGIVMGIAQDITAEKEAELVIRNQEAQLINASRFASLGEMAGGIAHEINTPLNSILMCAEKIKENLSPPEPKPDEAIFYSSLIEDTSVRIGKIISGLRSFARDSASDSHELVDIQTVVEQTLSLGGERMVQNGIRLDFERKRPSPVRCQSVQIGQVVLNLLNNAFDAISGQSGAWISITTHEIENSVQIAITNSGPRIPKAIEEKLFQPFFTTKGIGKGTGLGLSISQGIIQAHFGRIFLNPQCEHTQFIIELPRAS